MKIVEPCCYHRQLNEMIDSCSVSQGCMHFFSHSDWDAPALLEYLAGYACGGTLGVAMIRTDTALVEALRRILSRRMTDNTGQSFPYVRRVILLTQPGPSGSAVSQRREIETQLGGYVIQGRIAVCEDNIGFRCMAARGQDHTLVIQGSINPQKSTAMQMFTLTASAEAYREVEEMFEMKARTKNIFRNIRNKTE